MKPIPIDHGPLAADGPLSNSAAEPSGSETGLFRQTDKDPSTAGESALAAVNEQLQRQLADHQKTAQQVSHVAQEWTATFDAISDFVSVHDAEFRIVRANKALAGLLGHHPKDLIGKKCHQVIHGTNQPWPECPHSRAIGRRVTVTAEIIDARLGIPLLVSCSPLFGPGGALVGSVHVARDISATKKAEQERERLIAQLQQALSTVRVLSGFLSICSSCKKIREPDGSWTPVEVYIRSRSEAEFSHGLCPECLKTLYPEYVR